MMKPYLIIPVWIAAVCLLTTSCGTTPPYDLGQSRTQNFTDAAVRYGSIGAAGAGGYFLANELTGGDMILSAGGAAAAAGLAFAANKYFDGEKMQAFDAGRSVGRQEARAELLNEIWTREAIYGLPPEGADYTQSPKVRTSYVPSRTLDGVRYEGGYQQVMFMP